MWSSVLRRTAYFGIPALSGWYVFTVARELSPTQGAKIQTTRYPPSSLIESYAIRKVVNPQALSSKGDSRLTTINIPDHVTDRQVLSWFVSGFFRSRIFALEAFMLRSVGVKEYRFAELENVPATANIWSKQQIPKDGLPTLHNVLFGVFRLVDANLVGDESWRGRPEEEKSYVDFSFGSGLGGFAGCHRFSVARIERSGGPSQVTPKLSCYICNINKEAKPFDDGIGGKFHLIYANLLFRAGIANIIRNLNHQSG